MLKPIIGFMYAVPIVLLTLYALHVSVLLILYIIHKSEKSPPLPHLDSMQVPEVLVQIPLRNERFVVKNVLMAVTRLEWPRDKLRIQILDDSDDDTYDTAISYVIQLQKWGYPATMIHRKVNNGYKAGALSVGMVYTHCEYIAIFDADFKPNSDFLKQTIPYLVNDPELAMVQTRWSFENTDYSFITNCEAMALEGHFVIDHIARNRSNLLMNFNGTAGVWRRRAIEQSGGWHNETLAEDLDLSYRAQIAGWKLLYLPEVTSPSQLPCTTAAFKEQQRRWAKGAAQTFRKLAPTILRTPNLSLVQKLMAIMHLSGYTTQFLFVMLVLLSLPMAVLYPNPPGFLKILGPISIAPLIYYALSQIALHKNGVWRTRYYPLLAFLGIAYALDIAIALLDGMLHWGGDFVRTPKYADRVGDDDGEDPFYQKSYKTGYMNILLLIYAGASTTFAFLWGVTHYMLPGIMFLSAQSLIFITGYFEHKKMREK